MTKNTPKEKRIKYAWLDAVTAKDSGLSSTDTLVARALADFMDDDGYCWPSLTKLSERTKLARSTLVNAVDRLEAAGFIEREPGHPGRSTRYSATFARVHGDADTDFDLERFEDGYVPADPYACFGLGIVDHDGVAYTSWGAFRRDEVERLAGRRRAEGFQVEIEDHGPPGPGSIAQWEKYQQWEKRRQRLGLPTERLDSRDTGLRLVREPD